MLAYAATIGTVTFILSVHFIIKFAFELFYNCDTATAYAPTPPRSTYGGKVCWITGASSGLGREMALQLAARGAKIILSSRREDALQKVAQECREVNGAVEVKVLPLDLNDIDSLADVALKAIEFFGRIDVLFNNGGVSTRVTARKSSIDVDVMVANVDYLSHVAITKAVLPTMVRDGNGMIINVGSLCSRIGAPSRTSYCGAKYALLGWMNALRGEDSVRSSNLLVLNVILGSTKTQVAFNAVAGKSPQETFGKEDENIQKGLAPKFVIERVLAAAHAKLEEVVIANVKEMMFFKLVLYVPSLASKLLKSSLQKYKVE